MEQKNDEPSQDKKPHLFYTNLEFIYANESNGQQMNYLKSLITKLIMPLPRVC